MTPNTNMQFYNQPFHSKLLVVFSHILGLHGAKEQIIRPIAFSQHTQN